MVCLFAFFAVISEWLYLLVVRSTVGRVPRRNRHVDHHHRRRRHLMGGCWNGGPMDVCSDHRRLRLVARCGLRESVHLDDDDVAIKKKDRLKGVI